MALELDTLSLDELKVLKRDVDAALKSFETRKKKEALLAAQKAAQEFGFSLDEVMTAKSGSKGVPKYANPEDSSQTWTGRGRQPNWIKAALAAGTPLEKLAI